MNEGTSQGRFLFELDGVTAIRATEVTAPEKKHTPFKLGESNRPNPRLGRGNFECSECNVKHAHALNETGAEFFQWLRDFCDGTDVERREARLIVLDEDGQTPVQTYELHRCVPISLKPETHQALGNDPSYFTFVLQPEDFDLT